LFVCWVFLRSSAFNADRHLCRFATSSGPVRNLRLRFVREAWFWEAQLHCDNTFVKEDDTMKFDQKLKFIHHLQVFISIQIIIKVSWIAWKAMLGYHGYNSLLISEVSGCVKIRVA
jgi:hypothetical protein